MPVLKISVIGCGHWGKNLIRNFSNLGVLHSVNDISPDLSDNYSKKYNVKSLTIDQILKNKKINGVVIATPPKSHFKLIKYFIKSEKKIFVEKPMTYSFEEAQYLKKNYKKFLKNIFVGHILHYHPIVIKIKSILKNTKVINIQTERKNFGIIREHEDVIWSFSPHDLSFIISIFDKMPIKISVDKKFITKRNRCDKASIHLKFNRKQDADIHLSWIEPEKKQKIMIQTEKYFIIFDDTQSWNEKLSKFDYSFSVNPRKYIMKKKYIKVKYHEPLHEECKAFLKLCNNNNFSHYTNFHESYRVLGCLDKI